MRLSSGDEQHGYSEKASSDVERSTSDHEQEEGLLDGFNKHSQDPAPSFSTSNLRKSLLWWTIFLAASLGCIAGVILFLISIKPATKSRKDGSQINTNDYLLDAEWDYSASPQRREYTWTVRDHVHNPDGIYRPMILINNQFPGPMVEVNEGDTIVVHVDNQATNATAIHWHGIYQIGTPYMDGTVGISQCPIAPGHSFTYEFTVTGQSGTYWWHGHQGLQSSDGLHGPLIIHSRDERSLQKIHYDTDRVIMVTDHYHDLSSALLWQYLMPDMENAEPVPESGLINGRNIRNCDDYSDRRCDNSTSNVGRPSFVLDRQKNHRLRIINAGAFAEFSFQIDGHELAVTEVDGTDVHPKSYHRLNISPAQRYSVVISSNSTSDSDTFWMRARMITTCFTDPPKTLQPDVFAVVKYEKNSAGDPTSKDWAEQLDQQCKDMNTTELVPVEEISAPETPDAVYYLRSNFEIGAYRLSRGFFNGSSWRSNPDNSTLQRTIDGLDGASDDLFRPSSSLAKTFVNDRAFNADRELVIQTTGVQAIDILISNFDDGAHPYHLHGYKYFVLAQGYGQPPLTDVGAAITRESLAPLYETLDLSNPLRRDTATADSYGWILLRVLTDNPGAWALHCHVSWHTEAGLLMQLLTNTVELAKMKIPKGNQELCAAQGIKKGMGPDDDDYIDFAKSRIVHNFDFERLFP